MSVLLKNYPNVLEEWFKREYQHIPLNTIHFSEETVNQDELNPYHSQIIFIFKKEQNNTRIRILGFFRYGDYLQLNPIGISLNVRELENILERAIALSDDNIITKDDLHLKRTSNDSQSTDETTETTVSVDPLDLAGQERQSIMQALEQTRWNKTAAAKLLGLSLRQLRYRLQKLDIE